MKTRFNRVTSNYISKSLVCITTDQGFHRIIGSCWAQTAKRTFLFYHFCHFISYLINHIISMIRTLFKTALRLSSHRPQPKAAVKVFGIPFLSLSSFFSKTTFHPTILKIQEGVQSKDIDSLLQEVSKLTHQDHFMAMKLLLDAINTERISSQIIAKQAFKQEVKKHPTVLVNLNIILVTQLSDTMADKIQAKTLTKQQAAFYLQLMDEYFQACSAEFPKVEQNQKYIFATMLNKTQFYVLFRYMTTFAEGPQKIEGLQKCRDAYNSQIQSLFQKLKDVKEIIKGGDNARIRAISGVVSELMMTLAECTGFHYQTVKEIYKSNQDREEFRLGNLSAQKNTEGTLSLFSAVYGETYVNSNLLIISEIRVFINNQLKKLQISEKDLTKAKQTELNLEFSKELGQLNNEIVEKLAKKEIGKMNKNQLYEIVFTLMRIAKKQCELASKTQEDEIRAVLTRVGTNFLKALEQSKDYHGHFKQVVGKLIDDMIVKIKEERQS